MISDKVLKPIEKLDSGGFGCVYKNLPCRNDDPEENQDKYVEKMQLEKYALYELKMGEIIKKIEHYDSYFAPLLKTCDIDISVLDEKLQQCEAIQKSRRGENIITTKIKNLGNKSISKIVEEWDKEYIQNQPKQFMRLFLESFLYLLHSISILQENQIIHNDLKENNIMYDETNKCPIVIDFGMSVDIRNNIDFKKICLTEDCQDKEEIHFFEYPFFSRCFEQNLMSKIYKGYLPEKNYTTQKELLGHLEDFIQNQSEQNNFHKMFQQEEDKNLFRTFYQSKIEEWTRLGREDNIPIDQCFEAIFEFAKNKMDVYSLLITYLYIMEYDDQFQYDLEKKERLEKAPYLKEFKKWVHQFALAPEYKDMLELKEHVQNLFTRLYSVEPTEATVAAETEATTTSTIQPSTFQSLLFPSSSRK